MNRAFSSLPSPNGKPPDRDPVASYLSQLNALWKEAEDELLYMGVAVPVEVEVATQCGGVIDAGRGPEPTWRDTVYLGWRLLKKEWRLCVGVRRDHVDGEPATCQWKAIAESRLEHRIGLARHYPKLKVRMQEAKEDAVPQALAAIAFLKQALDN
jgi:hypothetical protein